MVEERLTSRSAEFMKCRNAEPKPTWLTLSGAHPGADAGLGGAPQPRQVQKAYAVETFSCATVRATRVRIWPWNGGRRHPHHRICYPAAR